jgi:hypothetical protein
MVATSSLTDCQRFADAVLAAGGRVPKPLTNILAAAGPAGPLRRPQ